MTEIYGDQAHFRYLYPTYRSAFTDPTISLVGSFNGWAPLPMVNRGDGLFELAIKLSPGKYQYNFIVNGVTTLDGSNSAISQTNNKISSELVIKSERIEIERYKFAKTEYVLVFFICNAVVENGFTVGVTGDTWSLGSFIPKNGLRMYTTPDTYPLWKTNTPVLVPRNCPFRYRYFLLSGNKFASFETIETPRLFQPLEIVKNNSDGEIVKPLILKDSYKFQKLKRINSNSSSSSENQNTHSDYTTDGSLTPSAATRAKSHSKPILTPQEPVNKKDVIIIVTDRLPLVIKIKNDQTWDIQWDNEAILSNSKGRIDENCNIYWVGTLFHLRSSDVDQNILGMIKKNPQLGKELEDLLFQSYKCIIIYIDDDSYNLHYNGFCKTVLFPMLHCIIDLPDTLKPPGWEEEEANYQQRHTYWDYYQYVNELFAIKILDFCTSQSFTESNSPLIWINDYQLMLVSYYLRIHQDNNTKYQRNNSSNSLLNEQIQQIDNRDYYKSMINNLSNTPFNNKLPENESDSMPSPTDLCDYPSLMIAPTLPNTLYTVYPLITFYIHTPFPTYEVFRTMPCRNRLLEGFLSSDLIGFHSYTYTRHFLACCLRSLGLNSTTRTDGNLQIEYLNRLVVVTQAHILLDQEMYLPLLSDPTIKADSEEIRNKYLKINKDLLDRNKSRKKLILSINHINRTSGIPLLLLTIERFIDRNPKLYINEIEFLIYVYRPRSKQIRPAVQEFSINEIETIVRRINNKYNNIIHYELEETSFIDLRKRVTLYFACDYFISTVIREGVNLMPLEYIFTRQNNPGVVILSEFSTSSCILNGVIRINPWEIDETVKKLDEVLSLTTSEVQRKTDRDIKTLNLRSYRSWFLQILSDLKKIKSGKNQPDQNSVTLETYGVVERLTTNYLISSFKSTTRRLILLDYGGTIVYRETFNTDIKHDFLGSINRKPSQEMLQAINDLASKPENIVFIISGSSLSFMKYTFGEYKNIGIAAEGGTIYCWPGQDGQWTQIKSFIHTSSLEWKDITLKIYKEYTVATNGSYIEIKEPIYRWCIQFCEPEWGAIQADFLVKRLETELSGYNVEINREQGAVAVSPIGLNRGLVVREILLNYVKMNNGLDPELIFCCGDDATDEPMFLSLYDYTREKYRDFSFVQNDAGGYKNMITCHVGLDTKTHAFYNISDVSELQRLLQAISNI